MPGTETLKALEPSVADPSAVKHLLEQAGVDQRLPAPPLSAWSDAVMRSFMNQVENWFPDQGEFLTNIIAMTTWIVAGLLVVGLVAALMALVRSHLRKRAKSTEVTESQSGVFETHKTREAKDPEASWKEFEIALADSRIRDATLALWWWLALTVAGSEAETWWTSGDLLRHTVQYDNLGVSLATLDAITYGRLAPSPPTLRALADTFRELV